MKRKGILSISSLEGWSCLKWNLARISKILPYIVFLECNFDLLLSFQTQITLNEIMSKRLSRNGTECSSITFCSNLQERKLETLPHPRHCNFAAWPTLLKLLYEKVDRGGGNKNFIRRTGKDRAGSLSANGARKNCWKEAAVNIRRHTSRHENINGKHLFINIHCA